MFLAQCTGTQIINSKLPLTRDIRYEQMLTVPLDYGPSLYASMNFDSKRQLLITAGWISVGVIANYGNALLLDRVGRVRLLGQFLKLISGRLGNNLSASCRFGWMLCCIAA
jgi:hypothetical protein